MPWEVVHRHSSSYLSEHAYVEDAVDAGRGKEGDYGSKKADQMAKEPDARNPLAPRNAAVSTVELDHPCVSVCDRNRPSRRTSKSPSKNLPSKTERQCEDVLSSVL